MYDLTGTRFCYGCLKKAEERQLYSYKLQVENQPLFQVENIDLCFLCKRLAQVTESFIQHLKSNQLLLANFDEINDYILDTLTEAVPPTVNLTKCTLKNIELNGNDTFDEKNPFSIINNNEDNDEKVKLELKQEDCNLFNNFDGDFLQNNEDDLENYVNQEDLKPLKLLKEELELEGIQIKCLKKSSKKKKVKKRKRKLKTDTQKLLDRITEGIKIESVDITRDECMEERALLAKDEKYVMSIYKCENCIKGFIYRHTYEKHMEKHNKTNGDYECDICKKRMASEEQLKNHSRYHFVRYKCVECGLTRCTRIAIRDHYHTTHLEVQHQTVFTCDYCHKHFDRHVKLKKHIHGVHSKKERVECNYCHKTYSNKDTLKIHITMRHPKEITLLSLNRKKHTCNECGKVFSAASILRNHMVKHTQARNHYCVECDKSFKSETTLKQHLKTTMSHASYSDLPLQCSQCDKRFAIRRDLDIHTNRVHLNIKPYQCEQCDKAYVRAWSLNDHRRLVHEGYKPPLKYPCPICDKAFARNHILKSHIRTHTGDRPYQCSQCPAQFSQAGILGTHVKLIHLKLTRDGRPKPNSGVNKQAHLQMTVDPGLML